MKKKEISDQKVQAIDTKKAIQDPQRIHDVVAYILEHFDQKTYRGDKTYIYNTLTNIAEVASAKRNRCQRLLGLDSPYCAKPRSASPYSLANDNIETWCRSQLDCLCPRTRLGWPCCLGRGPRQQSRCGRGRRSRERSSVRLGVKVVPNRSRRRSWRRRCRSV